MLKSVLNNPTMKDLFLMKAASFYFCFDLDNNSYEDITKKLLNIINEQDRLALTIDMFEGIASVWEPFEQWNIIDVVDLVEHTAEEWLEFVQSIFTQ